MIVLGGLWVGVLFNLACFNNTLVSHVLDVWKLLFQLPFEMEMDGTNFSETQHRTMVFTIVSVKVTPT